MGGRKDIYKDAKGFNVNPQNINKKGAPRKLIGTVNKQLEEKGVIETTPQEIKSCYLRLLNLPTKEIEELVEDETQPSLIRIVGGEVLAGKGFEVIEKMMDRAIGKAQQSIDHSNKDGTLKEIIITRKVINGKGDIT